MKAQELTHALEGIATEGIPADVDLWPALQVQQGPQATRSMIAAGRQVESRRLRLAFIPLAVLLAAVVTILVLGPQRVWADIQRLFGYVPGIGITNLEEGRMLAAPVEVTREGMTLRVDEFVAARDNTQIVLTITGLSHDAPLSFETSGERAAAGIALRLPDGHRLEPEQALLSTEGAKLQFPALPPDVSEVVLEMARLPLARAGAAPEDWQVRVPLQPASAETVASRFTQPYALMDATASSKGITVRVMQVAHTEQETIVQAQITWPDLGERRMVRLRGPDTAVLRDDQGRIYAYLRSSSRGMSVGGLVQKDVSPDRPSEGNVMTELIFAPLQDGARTLTLEVRAMEVQVRAQGEFTLDLGPQPKVGDVIPVDEDLQIAGFSVHISSARLVEEVIPGNGTRIVLQFDLDPVADNKGLRLRDVMLRGHSAAFPGAMSRYDEQTRRVEPGLDLERGATIPPGPMKVEVLEANVEQAGPWQVTWDVPEGAVVTR